MHTYTLHTYTLHTTHLHTTHLHTTHLHTTHLHTTHLTPTHYTPTHCTCQHLHQGTSFELGLLDDNNLMLIIKNSTSTFSQSISFANSLTIQFARSTSVLTINNNKVSSSFFQRLSDVKAWFGGINNNYATR